MPATALAHAPSPVPAAPAVGPLGDRRAAPRVRVAWRIQLRCGAEELVAHSADVSLGGLFLELARPIELGAIVHLSFGVGSAHGRALVEAEGRVVRRIDLEQARRSGQLPGVGVSFTRVLWGGRAFAAAIEALLRLPAVGSRRIAPRVVTGIPVYWGHDRRERRHAGMLSNLSTSGAFFVETASQLPRGSRFYLSFEAPVEGELRIVRATARVARVAAGDGVPGGQQPQGMGITLETSPVDQRTLASFLDGRIRQVALQETAERTHPTHIDELVFHALADGEGQQGVSRSTGPPAFDPGPHPHSTTRVAGPMRPLASATSACLGTIEGDATIPYFVAPQPPPAAPPGLDWTSVLTTALKLSGAMAAVLFGLFLTALLGLL